MYTIWACTNRFLSTLSLRRATSEAVACGPNADISIHALLAESDGDKDQVVKCLAHISIHALLAESDPITCCPPMPRAVFLSTLSLRRATALRSPRIALMVDFYPRSPCGERLLLQYSRKNISSISIHALLAESDDVACGNRHKLRNFYPRSPCGERRQCPPYHGHGFQISIHALLAESDEDQNCASSSGPLFLSTLSLRRATSLILMTM